MIKQCKHCGKEFEAKRNYQKYCSNDCRNKHYQDYHKEYYKKNREKFQKYREEHREQYKEYRKKYRKLGSIKNRLKFPCFEYIEHYVDKIPTEMCLNCSADKCRFNND